MPPASPPALDLTRDAVDILRRLEPALKELRGDVQKIGTDLARLEGRVSQLPTIWQVVGAVLAINAGIMALGFALAGLLRHQ